MDTGLNDVAQQVYEQACNLAQYQIQPIGSMEGCTDRTFDYNGGNIELDFNPIYNNSSDIKPMHMSLGITVTLNGIPQNISVNGSEETQFYVQDYYLDETGMRYTQTEMKISFEPVIAEEDKNEKALLLSVATTFNPHYEISDIYPAVFSMHGRSDANLYLCNVKTPITKYSNTKIGTGFTEELITESLLEKYKGCYNYSETRTRTVTIDDNTIDNDIFLTEDGKVEAGAIFAPRVEGKYRLYFLVNGENAKLTDGTDCIEVDTKVGYLYYLAPVEIAGAEVYDSISVFPVKCTSERTGFTMASIDFPWVIRPAEDEGKASF